MICAPQFFLQQHLIEKIDCPVGRQNVCATAGDFVIGSANLERLHQFHQVSSMKAECLRGRCAIALRLRERI
jgi:hypothetical protein